MFSFSLLFPFEIETILFLCKILTSGNILRYVRLYNMVSLPEMPFLRVKLCANIRGGLPILCNLEATTCLAQSVCSSLSYNWCVWLERKKWQREMVSTLQSKPSRRSKYTIMTYLITSEIGKLHYKGRTLTLLTIQPFFKQL